MPQHRTEEKRGNNNRLSKLHFHAKIFGKQLQYSSNTDHDYDGISTTTGEYNNDTFYFKDVSMESTIKDEAKATAIFQDFNNDVDKWKLKYPTGTSTREEQSRYASYLSEHYLASRLDPLAGTTHGIT